MTLTWEQVTWAVGSLLALGAAWADIRTRLVALEKQLTAMDGPTRAEYDARNEAMDARLDRLENRA